MLDPNLLRNEPDAVAEKLARRGFKLDVDKLRQLQTLTVNPIPSAFITASVVFSVGFPFSLNER